MVLMVAPSKLLGSVVIDTLEYLWCSATAVVGSSVVARESILSLDHDLSPNVDEHIEQILDLMEQQR